MRFPLVLMCIGACMLLSSLARAGTVRFSYEEALKRAWSHEVLTFTVFVPKASNHPETMFVTDETGAAVPAQVSPSKATEKPTAVPVEVSLIADFAPWQQRTWTLHYDEVKPAIPATDLRSTEEAGSYVLSNGLIALRTGRGEKTFTKPMDPAKVPAPLLAVRGVSGAWLGRGWLESPFKVVRYQIALEENGPIFQRIRAHYQFDHGYYDCTVTLRAGEDVVHFHEEFDMGAPSKDRDSHFCFSLYQGLQPDTVRWTGWYVDKKFNQNGAVWLDPAKEAMFSIDYANPGPMLRLYGLFYWWEQSACYYGAYRQDKPQGDLLAIFPERPGHWSHPTAIFLESRKGPDLVIKAPIRLPVPKGTMEGVEDRSPYMSGSIAPGTPENRGIREWGLLVSSPAAAISAKGDFTGSGIRKAWTRYGQNPLDKIKDWTLRWNAPGAEAYPRSFVTRDQLPALRARVKQNPELQKLLTSPWRKRFAYMVTQDPKLGDALLHDTANGDGNWMGLLPRLRFFAGIYLDSDGDIGSRTHMHRAAGMLRGVAPQFDVAMSIPEMTAEERREANALYAFLLYKLSDPDYLAYGTGFHLGNVNMPAMAVNVIGYSATEVPEHPNFANWALPSAKATLDILRDYTAPGGAWRECPHYQLDGTIAGVMQSATTYKNSGFLDLYQNPFFKSNMLFNLKLLTPVDPRFGIRTLPAIGNGSYESTSLYGHMAAGTAKSDPEYSKWMEWGWKAVGQPIWMYENDESICDDTLPAAPPDMRSAHFPGFGSIMRSHFGDPNETYLAYRMGYQIEHYEDDQGEIVLYSRGAPLVMDFGSLYQPAMGRSWMHNCVSIDHWGHWEETGEITQSSFLNAADACLGTLTVNTLTKQTEDPKDNPPPNMDPVTRKIAPTTWTRQVMLVKNEVADAPHYVLVRDGLEGKGDQFTDFTLWCLAKGVETQGNTVHYPGQFGMDLTVTMLDPVKPEFTTGKYGHNFLYEGPSGTFWRKVNGTKPWEEVQHYFRVKRTDHQGYFAVLYPHRPNEAVPVFTPWGNGAGVRATVNGEEHIAVCTLQPGQYAGNGVAVDGQRAVVRRTNGRMVLALLQGTRLAADGIELRSPGPAAITLADKAITGEANLAAPGEITIKTAATAKTAVITTDRGEQQATVTAENGILRIALPAGRCTFVLK
jgi:hypothetical protein